MCQLLQQVALPSVATFCLAMSCTVGQTGGKEVATYQLNSVTSSDLDAIHTNTVGIIIRHRKFQFQPSNI
jgi:hypothetical protein